MRFLLILLAFTSLLFAQPQAAPMPSPEVQYLDQNGAPLAGAKLCSYAAGTTTPQATYADSTATIPNSNPVILDSYGRASVWVKQLGYKFVLLVGGDTTCSTGFVAWSQDNVWAVFQQVGSLNSLNGSLSLVGTANEINISSVGHTITLSTPQAIDQTATPTFGSLTLTNGLAIGPSGTIKQGSSTLLDGSGNLSTPGSISGGSFQEGATVVVDSSQNATFHNLTVSGTCSGCGTITTQTNAWSSRAQGTVYQNTGTTARFVSVTIQSSTSAICLGGYSDGNASPSTLVAQYCAAYNASQIPSGQVFFFVLPGNYYKVSSTTSNPIIAWIEWQ